MTQWNSTNKKPWHYLLSIKTYLMLVVLSGALLVGYLSVMYGSFWGFLLAILPLGLSFAILGIERPKVAFFTFFIINYFIMGISRYAMGAAFPFGVVIDAFMAYMALIIIFRRIFYRETQDVNSSLNGFTLFATVWLVYCFIQAFNPLGLLSAWLSAFRGVAFYMFAMAFLTPLFIKKVKDCQSLMLLWSILTILAVLKALIQKIIGFDDAETYWLFVGGGSVTHIIHYGIRYFSFFTDASNFGAQMAMSMTVFTIYLFFIKQRGLKIWFAFVASLALYGMLISGTRAALAIPFVGFTMFVILSKRWKFIIPLSITLVLVFSVLKFTNIGSSNYLVRRMRSALDANDPSMSTRYRNQALLKVYMVDKPFGAGLGLSGVKAANHTPGSYLSTIPTDSWFVMLWVETGWVGLILNLSILIYIMGYGSFQVLFRIRSDLVRGINIALIAGCSGMIVASYANEILGQFPNGIIIYISMAMIFLSPKFDKELS